MGKPGLREVNQLSKVTWKLEAKARSKSVYSFIQPPNIYWKLSMCQTLNLYSIIFTHYMFNGSFSMIGPEEFKRKWMNRCWKWRECNEMSFCPYSWVESLGPNTIMHSPHTHPMKDCMSFTLFLGSSMHRTPWLGAAALLSLLVRWVGPAITLRCSCFTNMISFIFPHRFHHWLAHLKYSWWLKAKSWGQRMREMCNPGFHILASTVQLWQ